MLPIDAHLPQITDTLRKSHSVVLVAPPGAGKTTRVPPAILRAGMLGADNPALILLQPRRIAARAIAARIAEENHWRLGNEVGYHIRFDRNLTAATRLRVLTEGILTRQLLADPFLPGIGAVLLDEFHERSIHSDLALALLREVQQTVRPDLLIVVMSATLEAEPVARYLGDCPVLRTEGRTFPIEVSYTTPRLTDALPDQMADAIARSLAEASPSSGDVLAFLPGAEEIRRTARAIESQAAANNWLVLPLHGSLPPQEQLSALAPASRRKIILSTNIAETSLTIDGVTTVIDSGLARVAHYDAERGMDRLDLQMISKASAAQRAGRAGRTAPGRCIRLWTEKQQHQLAEFDVPEIHRVDLASTVLTLHAWGKPDLRSFGWYDAPPEPALMAAENLLTQLGALDPSGKITRLGERLVTIPAHPRVARLLLAAADANLPGEGAAVAALISEKDILLPVARREPPATAADSDLVHRLALLQQAEAANFAGYLFDAGIDVSAARQVARIRDQFLRMIPRAKASSGGESELLLRLPLLAYPDRVCKRRANDPSTATIVGGGGVKLAGESLVRRGEYFLAIDVRHDPRSPTRQALVRIASVIEVEWLAELFPQSIIRERGVRFDESRQRVVGFTRMRYLDLTLEESADAAVDPGEAGAVLAEALRPRAVEMFHGDAACAALLSRVALLRRFMPEQPWPAFDEPALAEALGQACAGKRSVEELRGAVLLDALRAQLAHPLDRLLEQHAPAALTVPTGNRIALQYAPNGEAPILAVRLQELFGLTQTPRIAGGRVAVKLHLLAPNYRPVQITDDLKNFWATTYFQVRKDLRARYPKHAWPDDPLTALPQSKGRPKK